MLDCSFVGMRRTEQADVASKLRRRFTDDVSPSLPPACETIDVTGAGESTRTGAALALVPAVSGIVTVPARCKG